MGANTTAVTDETFLTEVLQSETPVLVDFWAEWCGPCKMIAPILEEIAGANVGKIRVVKLDIDANPETARQYGIMGIPTMNVYVNGEVVKSITGAKPKGVLLKELADYVG